MKDAIRSTTIFICHHIVPFIVFCLAGAGVLITIVLGRYSAEAVFRSSDIYRTANHSRYVIFVSDAGEEQTKAFLSDLNLLSENVSYFSISGLVEVRLNLYRQIESSQNTHDSVNDMLYDKTRLTAFFPTLPKEKLVVNDGVQSFSEYGPELMYALFYSDTINSMYLKATDDLNTVWFEPQYTGAIIVNEAEPIIPIGDVYVTGENFDTGLYTAFEDYFYFTDQIDRIIVQFDAPLSESEGNSFIDHILSYFTVNEISMPFIYSDRDIEEYNKAMNISRAISLLCMLGIFVLFRYMIKMRRDEFRVLRMMGGTRIYVGVQMLIMLFFSVLCSFIPALFFLHFLKQSSTMYDFLEYLNQWHVFLSVVDFVGILLICACLFFIADVARFKISIHEEK